MPLNRDVTIKYLGHSTFLVTTPGGQKLLLNPWVQNNPACPEESRSLGSLDTMLITHGHGDHMQDAVTLAKQFEPQIACIYEIALWLGSQGVENVTGMNKGGSLKLNDVIVTMVNAHHSSGIEQEGGKVLYAGEPAGYVVEFENGYRIYHAGDTCLFGDMKLIGELYQPELVFLPIGDLYTMDPRQAAYACRLLGTRKVVPMHYGTFPVLTGTPERLKELLKNTDTEVLVVKPGEVLD